MITKDNWRKYIDKLSAIDERAADLMRKYINENGLEDEAALINYAYALVSKYGDTSATLSCEMYDYMAEMMGADVPEAIPAATATYKEVASGTMWAKYHSPSQIPTIVSRQVRQAGADTMIQNAKRDNAEWAWVPQGDTCAFCITLASRGWQKASETVLKGNHAEHIHQNCNCTFAIAFKPADRKRYDYIYDPDRYKQIYDESGGDINAMRRKIYEVNKDKINAQRRDVYQAKKYDATFEFSAKINQSEDNKNRSEEKVKYDSIGYLNKKISTLLKESFGSLQTDEVILTKKQIDHIKQRHPEDYDYLTKYLKSIIEDPDLVLKDENDYGIVLFIKGFDDTRLNASVRLVLAGDNPNYKNSVLSFYRLGDKGLKKKLKNCSVVYKKDI